MLRGRVRVTLCHGDRAMAHQFADDVDIVVGHDHVGAVGVPELMHRLMGKPLAKGKQRFYDKWGNTALSVGFLTIILVASALAQGSDYIYWVEKGTSTIRRADLDGSNVQDHITGVSDGKGMALDLTNELIYWVERGSPGKIRRANLDGSNVQDHITGVNTGTGIEIHGQYIYWGEAIPSNKIRRANLDGSGPQDLVTSVASGKGIALTNQYIYWVEVPNKIRRADLDGNNVQENLLLDSQPLHD